MPTAAALSLFLAAWLGHLVILIAHHNWWYGQNFSKRVGDVNHAVHFVLFFAGPAALFYLSGWDPRPLLAFTSDCPGRLVAGFYLAACYAAAFIALPLDTVRRNLRPKPAALLESRSEVIDAAKELGRPPVGQGRQHRLAMLPYNEVFQVEFAEHTLRLPRLPSALGGLTVLHLSDLHLCGTPDRDFYRLVMERCAAWEPDLVAITGDIADSFCHQRWIVPVLGRLRWRAAGLAILGNHDYWYEPPYIRRRLRRLGFRYLGNAWEEVEVRGPSLVVVGHEGPWVRPAPDLSNCPTGPFRLCLSHTPDNFRWARRNGIDLMLSGHVHGGQIRLPLFGSVLVPSRYGRRFDCGLFDLSPTLLYVSRGLGGEHPLRYYCRPEATLLTLRNV